MKDTATSIVESIFETGGNDLAGNDETIELTEQMIVRMGSPVLYRIGRALVLFVLATMPVFFGAVQAWVWSVYTVVIYAAFVVFAWQKYRARSQIGLNGYDAAAGLFFGLTLFYCLPLSGGLLASLSPVRHQWLQQVEMLTGMEAMWPTLSYAPFRSLSWWAYLLGLGLLFVQLKTYFVSRRILVWSLWIILGVAVAQGLYGILQALIPNLGVLWVSYLKSGLGNARGTWINRNHFAGFMGMMLPLMLGFFLSRVRWGTQMKFKDLLESDRVHQHSLFLLALVIMALALLFSKSRSGITAAFLGLTTFFMLIRGKDRKMPKQFWVIAGAFFSLILFYGLRMGFDPIIDRFMMLDQGDSRLDYWKDSLAIIADHPLGIGLATFKIVFPVYNVTSMTETVTPYYLHNDVLQLLVETGWPGFSLLLSAFLVFMANSLRQIRRMNVSADPKKFFYTTGAFSGLVSISFHSLFDFNLQIPSNAMYFVVLLAVVRAAKSNET